MRALLGPQAALNFVLTALRVLYGAAGSQVANLVHRGSLGLFKRIERHLLNHIQAPTLHSTELRLVGVGINAGARYCYLELGPLFWPQSVGLHSLG